MPCHSLQDVNKKISTYKRKLIVEIMMDEVHLPMDIQCNTHSLRLFLCL